MTQLAILIGSRSDWEVVKIALPVLTELRLSYIIRILSTHRTPKNVIDFAENSTAKLFICCAGGAAHLAGLVSSVTDKPVIGVPIRTKMDSGLDSLLSTVQMPTGTPVACMSVDGIVNAVILAAQMLAIEHPNEHLTNYRKNLRENTLKSDELLQKELFKINSRASGVDFKPL